MENAWKNDRSVDDTIKSHRDSYAELENRKKEALAAIDETNQQKEALREHCGVDADSKEQQDLLLLEKEQDYKNGVLDEGLTDEEYDRLAEIHKKPLTGYQKQALELNNYAADHKREIRRADYGMTAEKQNVSRIKLERLKTHAMVDAQGAADDIMDAANDEIIGMLVQEAKDQQDEKMDEAKEKADEAMKEKEEREEKLDEMKLERAIERAMIEGTDEAVEEAERIKRQNDSPDIQMTDMMDLSDGADMKKSVDQNLGDIKSSMKVLEADLKGIKVDEKV